MIARFGVSAGCSGRTGLNPVLELSTDWRNTGMPGKSVSRVHHFQSQSKEVAH